MHLIRKYASDITAQTFSQVDTDEEYIDIGDGPKYLIFTEG